MVEQKKDEMEITYKKAVVAWGNMKKHKAAQEG